MVKTSINLALCEGRHEIPQATDGFVFSADTCNEYLLDPKNMQLHAYFLMKQFILRYGVDYGYHYNDEGERITLCRLECVTFNLYVTGLSVALIAFINAFNEQVALGNLEECRIVLWHYNRDTGDYYSQEVV